MKISQHGLYQILFRILLKFSAISNQAICNGMFCNQIVYESHQPHLTQWKLSWKLNFHFAKIPWPPPTPKTCTTEWQGVFKGGVKRILTKEYVGLLVPGGYLVNIGFCCWCSILQGPKSMFVHCGYLVFLLLVQQYCTGTHGLLRPRLYWWWKSAT